MKFKKIDPLKDEDGFYNNVVELANNGNTKQAVNLVMKYIPDFIRVKSPLVTKLYNVTGNVCLYSGNYALAIDYYRRGLVYCEKMNDVDFFDIDDFKAYNDTYGHNEGNKCLSKISEVLSNFSNDKIFPARYGGDEFIILFSDMTVAEIREFAEKLRDAVSDLKIAHTGAPNGRFVTISQGIASAVPNESIKTWDLLRSADLNLYEVKQKGKGGIGCRAAERHDPR